MKKLSLLKMMIFLVKNQITMISKTSFILVISLRKKIWWILHQRKVQEIIAFTISMKIRNLTNKSKINSKILVWSIVAVNLLIEYIQLTLEDYDYKDNTEKKYKVENINLEDYPQKVNVSPISRCFYFLLYFLNHIVF